MLEKNGYEERGDWWIDEAFWNDSDHRRNQGKEEINLS